MSDLTDRLRNSGPIPSIFLVKDAADEIERLERERDKFRDLLIRARPLVESEMALMDSMTRHMAGGFPEQDVQSADKTADEYWVLLRDIDAALGVTPVKPVVEPLTNPDGTLQQFMPKVNGVGWRCECGCNVFHKPNKNALNIYECNGCGTRYDGE